MKSWVGYSLTLLMVGICIVAFTVLMFQLFIVPSGETGLPEAFKYFSGVFSRG